MPIPSTVNVPEPTLDVPNINAPLLKRLTALAPLLFKPTAPVKLLPGSSKVITPAPALIVTAPAAAAWVIGPISVTPKPVNPNVPVPTLEESILNARVFVTATLLAPLLLRETAPVKALFCVNVIACAPAVKLDVPGMVNTPVWVILPAVVTLRLPLVDNVTAGNEIPPPVKLIVKSTAVPVIALPSVNIPVPAPPIVLLVAKVIGAFKVMPAPL